MNEAPSSLGAKRCLEWINACKAMGWPKSAIPRLVDIFWEFKDRDGNLKGESPTQETEVRCTCKDFPGADEFCTAHKAPGTPVEQPNDAFRWICVHCTTVNSNLVITCDSCARERYPRLNRVT